MDEEPSEQSKNSAVKNYDFEEGFLEDEDDFILGENGRKKRKPKWTNAEALLLVEATKQFEFNEGVFKDPRRVHKLADKYEKVSKYFNELGGNRSAKECQNKWHNLYQHWKAIRDFNSKYFTQFDLHITSLNFIFVFLFL
jgi:hypothetical protein